MTDGSFNPPGGSTPPPPPPTYSAPGAYSPAYPPAPAPPKKGTPKWVVPVVLIAVIAAVGGLVLALRSSDKSDNTDGIRDGFVSECVNSMQRSTCECWWDELMQRFSAEELVKLGLTETSDPASDQKIQDALTACL